MKSMIVIFTIFVLPGICFSANIYVPGTYPTIQAGINAAGTGDTVFVAPGTYNEVINFNGKAITVKGTGSGQGAVIDGNFLLSVVTFNSGEGPASVLEGFTITNGSGTYLLGPNFDGGAVICYNSSSPTIRNNMITGNTITGKGGGIYCYGNSSPVIENNFIANNSVGMFGGGIFCYYACSPTIRDNQIYQNSTTGVMGGGGIYLDTNCSPMISRNWIFENSATYGGAMGCFSTCSPNLENNFISGNTATSQGGGIWCDWSTITSMTDSISGNGATGWPGEGGGIYIQNQNSSMTIVNTILWNNTATAGPEIYMDYGVPVSISYSDVMGDQAGVFAVSPWSLTWGAGMIAQDPLFVLPAFHDLHLFPNSPCINRGTNTGAPADDIDTEARPLAGTVDMGADEHPGPLALEADVYTLSEASGGQINLTLKGGAGNANRVYLMLGSVSGTGPGMLLPGDMAMLPLNWDVFTDLVLTMINSSVFQNFLGFLDASGNGAAIFDTLGPMPTGLVGATMSYAYTLNSPFNYVSNPVGVLIVP